ncbi:hypothetical protein Tco_0331091 [Tanacetum coccineum]
MRHDHGVSHLRSLREAARTVAGARHTPAIADIPRLTRVRKRLLLTTPRPGCEVGESSVAAAARQPGPTMARRVDCNFVDTVETRVRDTERRMMAVLEVVNLRVSFQVDVHSRESSEFYSRHHDAQKDRAAVRAEIEARRHEWQRQDADDRPTRHIMRIQALEAGARDDTLDDTENGAPKRTTGLTPVTSSQTATTTTVTEAHFRALIDRGVAAAMVKAEANRKFMKCKPLDFKGTEGVVGLTRWFEKMESVFSISNCTASCQVKFATCTLQDDALCRIDIP